MRRRPHLRAEALCISTDGLTAAVEEPFTSAGGLTAAAEEVFAYAGGISGDNDRLSKVTAEFLDVAAEDVSPWVCGG